MEKSFPKSEYREYEEQKLLTKNNLYNLMTFRNEKNILIAFMATWNLKNFKFIEHIAVDEKFRGMGIGTKIVKEFIENSNSEIVLEIEPPIDNTTIKRLNFYKKLGFVFNKYIYYQPPIRKDFEKIKLNLLSYPQKLSKKKFRIVREEIYKNVYNIT